MAAVSGIDTRSPRERANDAEPPRRLCPSTFEANREQGLTSRNAQAMTDALLRSDASQAVNQLRHLTSLENGRPLIDDLSKALAGLSIESLLERERIYQQVLADYPCSVGKAVSKKERDDTGRHHSTLVYGEITFEAFALVLDKIKSVYGKPGEGSSGPEGVMQGPGGIFYDIGSGTGKPVFAAAALHPFEKAVGIEILEGLHTTSVEILKKWESEAKGQLKHIQGGYATEVDFVLGDITDVVKSHDWTDGDVLFANSTCFDDKLMAQLASVAAGLKSGAFFVTLTKRLPSPQFKILESEMYTMSWGGATVYIQQKVDDPQT